VMATVGCSNDWRRKSLRLAPYTIAVGAVRHGVLAPGVTAFGITRRLRVDVREPSRRVAAGK
jgi:hypothetical protein